MPSLNDVAGAENHRDIPPFRPPDFVAIFGQLPRGDEAWPAGLWDTVLCVNSHCWAAQLRLLQSPDAEGGVAEVWLRHRESALPMFHAHTDFMAWRNGAYWAGYVLAGASQGPDMEW
jgi:hypothetical protein